MESDNLISRLKDQCRRKANPPGRCLSCQAISRIEELERESRHFNMLYTDAEEEVRRLKDMQLMTQPRKGTV
jgi:hypothetical protein